MVRIGLNGSVLSISEKNYLRDLLRLGPLHCTLVQPLNLVLIVQHVVKSLQLILIESNRIKKCNKESAKPIVQVVQRFLSILVRLW